MNTTKKYIFGEEVIELMKFRDRNIEILEIWIESKTKDKKNLIKSYKIDSKGRIKTLRRYDEEWTAYPPLNFTNSTNAKKVEFFYKETLHWTENEQLDRVQIEDIRSNEIIERKYVFQSNVLVEIDDQYYHQHFYYDDQLRLKELSSKLKVYGLEGSAYKIKFVRNTNGQIIEKRTIQIFESDTDNAELVETFKYNRYGQIESSMLFTEDNDQSLDVKTTFSYLSPDSDSINSIVVFENGERKSVQSFEYSTEGILISISASNSDGLFTKTTYHRE